MVNLSSWESRDYGVYKGASVPSDSQAKNEYTWFWLNKSTDPNDKILGIIDGENLNRWADQPRGKAGVVWSVKLTERYRFDMDRYFQGGDCGRNRRQQNMHFLSGFISVSIASGNTSSYNYDDYTSTGCDSDPDDHY